MSSSELFIIRRGDGSVERRRRRGRSASRTRFLRGGGSDVARWFRALATIETARSLRGRSALVGGTAD